MIIAKGSLTGNLVIKQSIQGKINKATEYIEIYPETQAKTVTPTKQTQTILPDENIYALSQVTINPIPDNYIEPQGQKEITDNGTYDVTSFASANIDIETGKLTNEEYADANRDLDEIIEGIEIIPVYPPDWSQLGYLDTPQSLIDDFNYSKQIKDNWDSAQTNLTRKFSNNSQLKFMPYVDTTNANDMRYMFNSCSILEEVPLLNTENVTSTVQMFRECYRLKSIPQFNTSKVTSMNTMFQNCSSLINIPILNTIGINLSNGLNQTFYGCSSLSNESLNNILAMCIWAINYPGIKTLAYIGLTSSQATICESLSNYASFLAAGWTKGY